jgi:hypothetical protein
MRRARLWELGSQSIIRQYNGHHRRALPYVASGNERCPQRAYFVAEFGYQPGAPVCACNIESGIAFEFYTQNRSQSRGGSAWYCVLGRSGALPIRAGFVRSKSTAIQTMCIYWIRNTPMSPGKHGEPTP